MEKTTLDHLFELGKIMITLGARDAMEAAEDDPFTFLHRHISGDWGNVCDEDKAENDYSLDRYLRIFSAYELRDSTKIWVITEADRSFTTILLPDEY